MDSSFASQRHQSGQQSHLKDTEETLSGNTQMSCHIQTTHQTAHGQLLDITTAPIGTVDLSKYTEETYIRIVTFKTAFYSFYLPVICGLLVGGVTSEEAFAVAKDICIQMGQYFQV